MIVIVGLFILFAAVIVAIVGVLSNTGSAHAVTEDFAVFGYHVTGSTGTVFVFGIVVGAAAMLGMGAMLSGARRTADHERDARHDLLRSHSNRHLGTAPEQPTRQHRLSSPGRWVRTKPKPLRAPPTSTSAAPPATPGYSPRVASARPRTVSNKPTVKSQDVVKH